MSVSSMNTKPRRPNEEPYAGKLLVRFREGLGRQLPGLLNKTLLLVASFAAVLFGAQETATPSLCGIFLGQDKAKLVFHLRSAPQFKAAEILIDTNVIMIAPPGKEVMLCDSIGVASIKCMFNRKKDVQAITLIFPAQNVDAVSRVYTLAHARLGEPVSTTSKTMGFKFEAEWKNKTFGASFFSSDTDFETYLLIGNPAFIKEEEARGNRSGD